MELHTYTRYVHSSTHARTPISTYVHHHTHACTCTCTRSQTHARPEEFAHPPTHPHNSMQARHTHKHTATPPGAAPAYLSVHARRDAPSSPVAAGPARTHGTRPARRAVRPSTPSPPRPGPRGRPRRNGNRVARARVGPARPTGSGPHVPAGHGGVPRVPGDALAERRAGAVRRTAPRVDAPCRYVSKGLLFVSGFRGRRSKSRRPRLHARPYKRTCAYVCVWE